MRDGLESDEPCISRLPALLGGTATLQIQGWDRLTPELRQPYEHCSTRSDFGKIHAKKANYRPPKWNFWIVFGSFVAGFDLGFGFWAFYFGAENGRLAATSPFVDLRGWFEFSPISKKCKLAATSPLLDWRGCFEFSPISEKCKLSSNLPLARLERLL